MWVSGGPVDRMDAHDFRPVRAGPASPSEADLCRGLDADDLPLVDLQEHGAEPDLPEGPSHDLYRLLVTEVGLLGRTWGCLVAGSA